MSLEEVFLDDIRENPEEDGPRLIYADWLSDQVAPDKAARADFIRLQCQRARLPPDDPDTPEMRAVERVLQAEHQSAWVGELADELERWEFHRGFVEGVTLNASILLARAPQLFSLGSIRRMNLRNAGPLVRELAQCEQLASVTRLALRDNGLFAGCVADLIGSTYLRSVMVLDLSRNPLGREGVRALVGREALPALEELHLNGVGIDAGGAAILVRDFSPLARRLNKQLYHRLKALHLADNALGQEGAQTIANAFSQTLVKLDLSRNALGAGGLTALLGNRYAGLGGVVDFTLSGNDIGPAGAEALANQYGLRTLRRLTLNHNGLGDDGADALVGARYSSGLAGLRELALAGNRIGPEGLRALLSLRCLPHLTHLNLSRNVLSGEGAERLASCEQLARLTELNLGNNRLGPAGVENVAASPHLTRLTRLDLSGNGFGERGVRALLDAPHLERLVDLNVSGNALTPDQIRRLRLRFGARVRV